VEHAPVMIWLSGVHGECLHLNQMLRNFWNVDENAIDRFDWQDMMHPEDAPEIGRLMREALARQSSVTIKGRYLDSQGRYRIMQTDARPRFSAKGEFLGMIGVNVDITEREEAERQLRDSEERFRLAVEAAPSGMVMTDGEVASS
jgi:PAS domain S-box-containing protein